VRLAPRIHRTPSTPRRPADPEQPGPGLRPGVGDTPGVVAFSDVDAIPDGASQGGGPVVGHDGAHGGVDPSRRMLMPALTGDTRLLVSFVDSSPG
jgi:hypothetical protein